MNELLIGLVGALIATNQPLAISNLIQQDTGVSVTMVNPNDPAEKELTQLMAGDQAALDEVDKWIRDNNAFATQGAGESREALNRRILARLESVRKDYEDLLRRYPDFARGHLAYGSFLNDIGEEGAAGAQYGKAAQLDPKNPAAWNQLANFCGENGLVTNAFVDYAKAIELNPAEPVYFQNLATTVYLFRNDARTFYGLSEAQVFDKALALYRKAMQLNPQNFLLAADYAESYYGIRPLRTNDALGAWTNTLQIAHDDNEREAVYIHLARIKMVVGRFAEARAHLNDVTNAAFADTRHRLERSIAEREHPATNLAERESAATNTDALLLKPFNQGQHANGQPQLGQPQQPKIFGQNFSSMFMLMKRKNNDLIVSLDIPSADGKTTTKGCLWQTKGQDPVSGRETSTANLFGLVWTPRVNVIGKLDLAGNGEITTNPDFNFDAFTNSPDVIPFTNGYAVNLFCQQLDESRQVDENDRHKGSYVTDDGRPLYGHLIRSRFGKLEEVILAP